MTTQSSLFKDYLNLNDKNQFSFKFLPALSAKKFFLKINLKNPSWPFPFWHWHQRQLKQIKRASYFPFQGMSENQHLFP